MQSHEPKECWIQGPASFFLCANVLYETGQENVKIKLSFHYILFACLLNEVKPSGPAFAILALVA